jgi:hypothetical protein
MGTSAWSSKKVRNPFEGNTSAPRPAPRHDGLLPRLGVGLATLALPLALGGCMSKGSEYPGSAADELPVTRAVLYNNGIGYFERRGKVSGDHLTISVRRDQVADFLKSLTVVDLDKGGRAVAVALPVDNGQEKQLENLPPQVREQGGILAMATAFRGASASLVTTAGVSVTGRIAGVEQLEVPAATADEEPTDEWHVTMLLDGDTLQSFAIDKVQSLRILDAALATGLDKALDVDLNQAAWTPVELNIELAGPSPHDIALSYVVEMPTWRPAYRVVVNDDGTALLQGWAVVDNVSGEDWNNVQMSLTAGTPLAFKYDLYTPHYVERPDLSPPEEEMGANVPDNALGGGAEEGAEAEAEGATDDEDYYDEDGEEQGAKTAAGAPAPAARSLAPEGAMPEEPPPPPPPAPVSEQDLERNFQALVSGAGVGSLFRYDLDQPVTVPDRQSALVSIVSKQVPGQDVMVFGVNDEDGSSQNPYRAILMKNDTGLVLEHGPVAIYRDNTFLGEALADRIESGSNVFVPYALDSRVTVFLDESTGDEGVQLLSIANGEMTVQSKSTDRFTYDVDNETGDKETLYVERAKRTDWTLTKVALSDNKEAAPPQPGKDGVIEEDSQYFVPIALPANGHVKIDVVEETPAETEVQMTSTDALQVIQTYISNPNADPKVAAQLKKVVDAQTQIAQAERQMDALQQQKQALSDRESGIRSNLNMLSKSTANDDLRNKLTTELAALDSQLDDITRQYVTLSEQDAQDKDALATLVQGVTLDTTSKGK